ncbi:XTP/dITP diphosphatase [candidate division KSB3 bacterium]|uniref:dITP/XTP pyrophosphatase n=1 Tax=candidate division KSB3 bacterium TaxID=2044937 RepID=A0A9D5Q4Q6_9BACT|nr:XTP/dITP diphosphatase [candidate division KSB3 bacterium]
MVVATKNQGKIREIREVLSTWACAVVPIQQLAPNFRVEEDGTTYADNAIKKAQAAASSTGSLALADDSGLEVRALNGAPGIYSARFGGVDLPQAEKNRLLLQRLVGVTDRQACFRCVLAVVSPQGRLETTEGTCEGFISTEPRGNGGFGFDPIFVVPAYQKTMAELAPDIKNAISHRARALQQLPTILQAFWA